MTLLEPATKLDEHVIISVVHIYQSNRSKGKPLTEASFVPKQNRFDLNVVFRFLFDFISNGHVAQRRNSSGERLAVRKRHGFPLIKNRQNGTFQGKPITAVLGEIPGILCFQ